MKVCGAGGSEGRAMLAPIGPEGSGLFPCDFSDELDLSYFFAK